MEKQPETRKCENCKYYLQHYAKLHSGFTAIHCGHCTHDNVKNYKRKPLKLCEYWENIAIRKEERKRSIVETIISMSNRLDELTVLLKDDTNSITKNDTKKT